MRALALLAAMVACSAGCFRLDTGAVLMHLDDPSADFFGPPTFNSSEAAVVFKPDGEVFFGASSNQGTLRVHLPSPLVLGATFTLPGDQQDVTFTGVDGVAQWGNTGGSLFVISVNPAIIRLIAVPMVASSGDAAGSFVFDGDGTFR